MYRRPKFLEKLIEIRCEMALEADYDVDLFAEIARSGNRASEARLRPKERMNANLGRGDADISSLIESVDKLPK